MVRWAVRSSHNVGIVTKHCIAANMFALYCCLSPLKTSQTTDSHANAPHRDTTTYNIYAHEHHTENMRHESGLRSQETSIRAIAIHTRTRNEITVCPTQAGTKPVALWVLGTLPQRYTYRFKFDEIETCRSKALPTSNSPKV